MNTAKARFVYWSRDKAIKEPFNVIDKDLGILNFNAIINFIHERRRALELLLGEESVKNEYFSMNTNRIDFSFQTEPYSISCGFIIYDINTNDYEFIRDKLSLYNK